MFGHDHLGADNAQGIAIHFTGKYSNQIQGRATKNKLASMASSIE
ncbi:hypothetical protein [Desulfobacula sp.]